jgi:hypothetical protein
MSNFEDVLPVQTRPRARSTVIGCTESLVMRRHVPGTGPAGTVRPRSSSASAVSSTTRKRTPVTGLRMLPAAKNIVSFNYIIFYRILSIA